MTKKKVSLKRSDDLTSVDDELEAAMARLDGTNERIHALLTSIDQGEADENIASGPESPDAPSPGPEASTQADASLAPE